MQLFKTRCIPTVISVSLLMTINSVYATPSSLPPLSLLQQQSPLYQLNKHALTQMDDPELVRELANEETLEDLQNIEYEREALSVDRGLLLSLIPGGGWSLLYANRRAQGVLMIIGAAVGYSMGAAYLLGVFDESAEQQCILTDSSKNSMFVGKEYCSPASIIHPTDRNANNPAYDPYLYKDDTASDPTLRVILKGDQPPSGNYRVPLYSEVRELYQGQRRGRDYDGTSTGQVIIASTYALTTVLTAIWTTVEINEQNNELRKRIESTSAQAPLPIVPTPTQVSQVRPTFQYDGQQTIMGLGGQF
jgi:hypothetical protein